MLFGSVIVFVVFVNPGGHLHIVSHNSAAYAPTDVLLLDLLPALPFTLPCPTFYLSLPYLFPYLALPCLTLPYLALPCLTLSHLPHLTLPYLALPYLTLPSLTLPYLTLPNSPAMYVLRIVTGTISALNERWGRFTSHLVPSIVHVRRRKTR